MYHEAHIAPISKKQVSKLLNGHPVRVKAGSHHKIHLSAEHHKKLHRAHAKGCGITVTLDPYAIEHNQHLRHDVGMGGKLGKSFGKFIVKEGLEPLITAGVQRGIRGIKTGHGLYKDVGKMANPLIPSSMRGMVHANMAKYKPTISAARTVGGKVNRLKKFNKWMGALGKTFKSVADYVKPVAKPLLQGVTNVALQRMGQPTIPRGRPRAHRAHAAHAANPMMAQVHALMPSHYPSMEELDSGNDLGLPPLPDNYEIPYGKAYASGIKHKPRHKPRSRSNSPIHGMGRKPKAHRPKRVMSEAQKAALAKGRAALRIKLNEMGAGAPLQGTYFMGKGAKRKHRKTPKRRHTGKSLMPAGY
jgi:hypothetical protein